MELPKSGDRVGVLVALSPFLQNVSLPARQKEDFKNKEPPLLLAVPSKSVMFGRDTRQGKCKHLALPKNVPL